MKWTQAPQNLNQPLTPRSGVSISLSSDSDTQPMLGLTCYLICDSQTRSISTMGEHVRNAKSQASLQIYCIWVHIFTKSLGSHEKKNHMQKTLWSAALLVSLREKITSSCEIRESFLEEVTSELSPKVAVFRCVEYTPAEGAVAVDSWRREVWRCVPVIQGLWAGIRQQQWQVSCLEWEWERQAGPGGTQVLA